MKHTVFRTALAAALASAVLAACGGGGDDDVVIYDPVTATTPSDSASASSQGFLDFIVSLSTGSFDSREGFDLSAFNAPTDDADAKPPMALSIDQ